MPIIYLLFSQKFAKFYVGSSRNKDATIRLAHHNSGSVRSTKFGRPWTLVEIEEFESYTQARKREIFLKSGVGRASIYSKFGYLKKH
ncbi:MAG: GIY-YIG nuclease family protein [Candidatus Liptonbacteria bacterium]|nr:GIY-YIG nuclease family protein [Candidatus Liptonbacteria bacterium]